MPPTVKIRNILLTTDFSESSAEALPYARYLAEHLGTVLYVLHVINNPLARCYGRPDGDYAAIVNNARAKAKQLMAAYETELGGRFEHHGLIREGEVVPEILNVVREKNIDTIVMAGHGEGKLRHILIGSTAQKVLQMASCPVYIVRCPEPEPP